MHALLHRRFWVIRFLGVAMVSAFAGSAASNALALAIVDGTAALLPAAGDEAGSVEEEIDDEPAIAAAAQPKPRAGLTRDRSRQAAASTLGGYNPFCPTCVPSTPAGPELLAQGGPASGGLATVPTKLPLRLSATMEAESPSASLATIYDVERGVVGVYGVGDEIRAGVVVTAVEGGRVHIRRDVGLELIELGVAPEPAAAKPTEQAAAKPADKPKDGGDPSLDAIQCASDRECVVERAFVEEILANPAKFAAQAPRLMPAPEGGFKVAGVRKNSLASKLGLKNGDVLLAVNGEALGGLDDAIGLVTKLRRASNLSVTIERKGASLEKHVEIR